MEKILCNSENCPNPSRYVGLCPTHYARKKYGCTPRTIDNSPHPECAVSHCDLEATSRKEGAFCVTHYQKKYRGIDPEGYVLPKDHPARSKEICLEPGCQKTSISNGLCSYHRNRARKGKTKSGISVKMTEPCSFEGCKNLSAQAGRCQTHYEQVRVKGVLTPVRAFGIYTRGELRCPVPNCKKPQQSKGHCNPHAKMLEKYSVTPEELARVWSNPACSNPGCGATTRLHMDHDHNSGTFRALLCNGCNSALGMLKEDTARISGLREYIERFQGGTE